MATKWIIAIAAIAFATSSATARTFSASDIRVRPLPAGVKVSNDSKRITAYATEGEIRRALFSIRSTRKLATRPFGGAVYQSNAALPAVVPANLAAIIREAASRHGVDPRLVAAVARQESAFNATAVSPVGAVGVMQLMPATAKFLGVRNALDARENVLGGTRYLKMLLDTFDGDLDLSLAAYNAGPGAVEKHRGIPPYRETQNYVASIRRAYEAALR